MSAKPSDRRTGKKRGKREVNINMLIVTKEKKDIAMRQMNHRKKDMLIFLGQVGPDKVAVLTRE